MSSLVKRRVLSIILCLSSTVYGQSLQEQVALWNESYWSSGHSMVSDAVYDAAALKLREQGESEGHKNNQVTGKVWHARPMKSLQKCYAWDELWQWAETVDPSDRYDWVLQPKYDGLAVEWQGGLLSTRGDGWQGQNVSHLRSLIKGLPAVGTVAYGELLIKRSDFTPHQADFKSPRHLAVGLVNRTSVEQGTEKILTFKRFDEWQLSGKWGEIKRQAAAFAAAVQISDWPTDGLVLKVTDEQLRRKLGDTAQFPRWSMAYKWPGFVAWTQITDIAWQFNARGLVPVAFVEPVTLDGRRIERVSLHNARFVKARQLGEGAEVLIELVGGTIPIVRASVPLDFDEKWPNCPFCGEPVVFDEIDLNCENPECKGVLFVSLLKQVDEAQIKGVGRRTLRVLVDDLACVTVEAFKAVSAERLSQIKGVGKWRLKQIQKLQQSFNE